MNKKKAARLGMCLEKLRKETGMSQADVAKIAGVSPASVGRLERGDTLGPRSTTLEAVVGAYGYASVDALLEAVDPEKSKVGSEEYLSGGLDPIIRMVPSEESLMPSQFIRGMAVGGLVALVVYVIGWFL